MKQKEATKWSQIPLESVGNMAFVAPSTLVAEELAEGTPCGFEFRANSQRMVQLQSICTGDIPFFLGAVQKDIQGHTLSFWCNKLIWWRSWTFSSCSGERRKVFSLVAGAVSPKLGGSANLARWRDFLEQQSSGLTHVPVQFGLSPEWLLRVPVWMGFIWPLPKNPSWLSKWLPYSVLSNVVNLKIKFGPLRLAVGIFWICVSALSAEAFFFRFWKNASTKSY